jgi:hypothetical protein
VPGVKSVALVSSVPMATDGLNVANVVPEAYKLPGSNREAASVA